MQVRCQCSSTHFVTPRPAPMKLYHCHCTECRRQSSSAFGTSAIFPSFELPLETQPIAVYTRATLSGGTLDCYFCKICGSRLMHQAKDRDGIPSGTCSVKAGVIEGLEWTDAEHIWCDNMVVTSMRVLEGVKCWNGEPESEERNATPSHTEG